MQYPGDEHLLTASTALSPQARNVADVSSLAAPHATVPQAAGPVRSWHARAAATWLLHSRAVILDVETTGLDGRVCEIAAIDTSGRVLLDTLVDPQITIEPDAVAVHGITDQDVVGAPTWDQLAPVVEKLLDRRTVIAYNAPFDRARVRVEQDLLGRPTPGRWWCLMRARSAAERAPWRALHGGHRALGDCRAALAVLDVLAIGPKACAPASSGGRSATRA